MSGSLQELLDVLLVVVSSPFIIMIARPRSMLIRCAILRKFHSIPRCKVRRTLPSSAFHLPRLYPLRVLERLFSPGQCLPGACSPSGQAHAVLAAPNGARPRRG